MQKNPALLIVDMQNDFVLPGAPVCVAGALATIPNIVRVLERFRSEKHPVFHVIREHRTDGSDVEITRRDTFLSGRPYALPGTKGCEIVRELRPREGECKLVKKRFSGFMNTELDLMLRQLNVDHVVVCGTQYPNCIRATIFDAVALGYHVTLVTDATSAQSEEIAEANILDIRNIGVACEDTETFLTPQSP